jgi:hypothetical protein
VVVISVFIASPLIRRLRTAGTALVESKACPEAQLLSAQQRIPHIREAHHQGGGIER